MTPVAQAGEAESAAVVVEAVRAVVDDVFSTLGVVRDHLLAALAAADRRGDPWMASDLAAIREPVLELLTAPGAVPICMGAIMAPDVLADAPLALEWWQVDAGAQPARMEVDLEPTSLGFYDYPGMEWFDLPRRTGQRHIMGPYVDILSTDLYVNTVTEPVLVDGRFIGVVGADLPNTRLERLLLPRLGADARHVVVLDRNSRVVLSTDSSVLVGSLLSRRPAGWSVVNLLDLPWTVLVEPRTSRVG